MRIIRPASSARIDDSNDIELRDVMIDTPRQANQSCLYIAKEAACSDVRVLGGWCRGATEHGIRVGSASYGVTGFQICNALVEGATVYGILVQNGTNGLVAANTVRSLGDRGIYEVAPATLNSYVGNLLTTASSTYPLLELPSTSKSEAIRNVAIDKDIADTGGFRQTIDGWVNPATLVSTQTGVELARNNFVSGTVADPAGRFRAVRRGSVTGLVITITKPEANASGAIVVSVFRNITSVNGAGEDGSYTGFQVGILPTAIVATATRRINGIPFEAGDEIYLVMETSGWTDTDVNVRCAVEIED